jgi:hypothetical protein
MLCQNEKQALPAIPILGVLSPGHCNKLDSVTKANSMPAKQRSSQPKAAKASKASKATKTSTAAKAPKATKPAQPEPSAGSSAAKTGPRLYTLEVAIMTGPISKKFVKQNPQISRTIQIRGDQTLEDLHEAIFQAFDRFDPHMYEFQFGKGPMDPDGSRYVMPDAYESQDMFDEETPAGTVDKTTLDSLGLELGRSFGYWFDFGDDWWHQINVDGVEDVDPAGLYPRVTNRIGKSPPQYGGK